MERVVVVGGPGAGKRTLARWLAGLLNLPHTELDALWWQPNWTAPDMGAFQAEVATVAQDQRWIVSGNLGLPGSDGQVDYAA